MFADGRELDGAAGPLRADLCIIGGGAAGITVARQLVGSGIRVVVLESGGWEVEDDVQDLSAGENVGLPYFPLETARVRAFGGSTNHWGGTCRPLDARDFEPRPGIPLSGWPIRLSDLEAHLDEAGDICGLGRPVSELDAAEEEDDERPLALGGDDFEARFNEIVADDERSFAPRHRDRLEAADDVAVHLWANVTGIVTDDAGGHVTHVEVATLTGNRYVVEARVVVLAAGGIENARILLASTARDPRGVGNARDQVGRYFMEHPRVLAARILPRDPEIDLGYYEPHDVGGDDYQGYVGLTPARLDQDALADVQLRLRLKRSAAIEQALRSPEARAAERLADWVDGSGPAPIGADLLLLSADLATFGDWFVPGGPLPVPLPDVVRRVLQGSTSERASMVPRLLGGSASYVYSKSTGAGPFESVDVSARAEQVPNPDSRVTLGSDTDALGMPRGQVDWQLTDVEHRSIVRAVDLLGAEVAARGIGRVQVVLPEDGSWPADLAGGWHHMGTTRMSADPATGVVDRDCRVHGIDNLYVAGSSVFSTAGSATPTLTLVALALRLADHLRSAWFR